MKRTQERENAFILVYEASINKLGIEELIDSAKEDSEIEIDDFVKEEVYGVFDNLEKIDSVIDRNCTKWDIKRVSKIALAALRIACYEIMFKDDIPVNVSINEAVNLTKKYAGEDDSAFINGVLGAISKIQL